MYQTPHIGIGTPLTGRPSTSPYVHGDSADQAESDPGEHKSK